MTAVTNIVRSPKTLRTALDFLAKLYQLAAGDTIGKALEDKVKEALKKLGGNWINLEESFTTEITQNFYEVLQKSDKLRNVIVKNKRSYGRYHELDVKEVANQCTDILLQISA
ncbi:secreted antigen 1 [Babesia caballi]|uniref:Secreted antigen 1 n=1 Tax=Babesia caballi TaxID=5871 RepID=A0AAV4LMH5_BABCB|nr:secreted antigen 1 [Babesia caballi]